MKVTLESTSRIVEIEINGVKVPARVWEGETAKGVKCYALITRIAQHKLDDATEFERDLTEHKSPSRDAINVFDMRFFLD